MKKILLLLTFAIAHCTGICQTSDLKSFDQHRVRITKKGMLTLGGWSAANIIAGAIGSGAQNRQTHYFHQMNMIWGATNLLFAGLGYWGATKENSNEITLTRVLLHQNQIEKTFIFNAGLDLTYVTAGLYLTERSRRKTDPAQLKGYGNSIILQGGFLFLFDAVMYSLHHAHGKKLATFTDKVMIMAAPTGFAINYRL